MAGIGTGRNRTGGTGKDDGPAARLGTTTGESIKEVSVAAETERANVETKREKAGTTRTGGRTGSTTKIEEQKGSGPGIKRAGESLTTGGTKRTGKGTGRRGRPKGRAEAKAGRGSARAAARRRAGKESAATAEMERGALTKRGAIIIISGSLATTTVNTVNAGGVRAPSKCLTIRSSIPVFPPRSSASPSPQTPEVRAFGQCNVALCLSFFPRPVIDRLLVFASSCRSENCILICSGSFCFRRSAVVFVHNVS